MEIFVVGGLLAVAISMIVYGLLPKQANARDTVKRRLGGKKPLDELTEIQEKAKQNASDGLVKKATPMLSRLVMPVSDEEQTKLRLKLASAGFRHRGAQTTFLASKTLLAVTGMICGVIAGFSLGYELKSLIGLVTVAAGVGFMAPNFWLNMASNSRRDKVRRGLPDTLDLMVVSVESGLALDAAIKRVGDEMGAVHPELSEEFRISTMESQMGIPRSEALDNMQQRVGIDEIRALVSVIAQAERFGTSIAKALRNQADALRTKRRQQAEERAQKTAVKLMIPLVLFIFPAMGVVLAGPAVIRAMEAFG